MANLSDTSMSDSMPETLTTTHRGNRLNEDERGTGTGGSVAIYWDFENLHAALVEAKYGEGTYAKQDNRFKAQEPLVDVQAIVELCSAFGNVAINRAYCNWQFFGRYRDALLQGSVELIQLFPPGASAKNGADIKLCLDAAEDISRFSHIRTVVIIGGDSDFMPVAQRIKAAGRTLIGIGYRKNTNRHWAKSCHEFRYYESLVEPVDAGNPTSAENASTSHGLAADMLRRAVRLLAEANGDTWVNEASVWPMIKRLDPTFSIKEHGFASFGDMLKTLDAVVEVKKGAKDHLIKLR
nr:NYN domain-containing protein [uncultured Cupriavidus sp.]